MAPAETLAQLELGCTQQQAVDFFDSLPALRADQLRGRWRGRGLNTAHPMDGLLESSGWYGKQFDDEDSVHPLLFEVAGEIYPVEPQRGMPIDVTKRASKPRARLREVAHRGVVSAAMIYDTQPIIDHFRRIDDHTILGLMDARGMAMPYFFILDREEN
ncbi:MAG TPA: DUF4334 domain-containing protein [Marmoricola sp.]|nr:DUF4334 domain-containing protein [Marmoricola sp.]HNN48089.1 DUF4334 domain-containing protein [Marmoricola sp.]